MAFQDIRKSRKFLSATDIGFVLGVLVLLAALLTLNIYLARSLQGGEWLFLRWSGVRAFMFEQLEPYGSTIAQRVQALVYGHDAFLSDYPYALNDPFYIVLLYTPLAWFFSDFAIARGVWMLLSQVALVGIVWLSLNLIEWKPPAWMVISLVGFGLFSYFSIDSLLSGSSTIFLILLYLGILAALRLFYDELAGVLLFLVAYQWEVGALFFLFILIFVIANRRWSVLVGLGMTLIVLGIVAFISNSGWVVAYIRAGLFDWNRGASYSFSATLLNVFPALNNSVGRWVTVLAGIMFLFEAISSVDSHSRRVIWVAFLTLVVNPIMGFAIFPSNHIVLLPAFVLVLALVWERWEKKRVLVSGLLLIVVLSFSFYLYYQAYTSTMYLYTNLLRFLPPILATIGLYWMRWWAVRPPRIWADQFGARREISASGARTKPRN
jgi:hypothetical protein